MACGYESERWESYWATCYQEFSYPCGIRWCSRSVWGVKIWYPCGIKWCNGSAPYLCRKTRKVNKWCYDFSIIGFDCKVFYETLYGCCGGKEYSWNAACFGWVSGFTTSSRTVCFDEPLEDLGSCREGKSIPRGGTVLPEPIDDYGSVSPGGVRDNYISRFLSLFLGQVLGKLGVCRSCMRLSFVGTALSSILFFAFLTMNWIQLANQILLFPSVALSFLTLAHILAFMIRRIMKFTHRAKEVCGCNSTISSKMK